MNSLSIQLKLKAKEIGFSAAGITGPEILHGAAVDLDSWLKNGFQGTMDWMEKTAQSRCDPRAYIRHTRSVLIVAINYYRKEESLRLPPNYGNISIYARGRDYHKVIRKKLKLLLYWIQSIEPKTIGRIFVDSFPIMEKSLAVKAGLGWMGKNTLLIIKNKGSFFFLGGILLNISLNRDEPTVIDHCGKCNLCQTACPTNALFAPRKIDATRCISYLTIEHQGKIDSNLQKKMGNNIFGCDICQMVCPWNRFGQTTAEKDFYSRISKETVTLSSLDSFSETKYEKIFAGTAVRRSNFSQFKRNIKIAVKNERGN